MRYPIWHENLTTKQVIPKGQQMHVHTAHITLVVWRQHFDLEKEEEDDEYFASMF